MKETSRALVVEIIRILAQSVRKASNLFLKPPVYAREDGSSLVEFASHEDYVQVQIAGNKRKINRVFADEATISLISDYLRPHQPSVGLCHGSRNGSEVRWFREQLGIDVLGTDISDTASDFGLIQWDFHDRNPEWVGQFDFVYTNSHDHAREPEKAFDAWMEQLSPGGFLFLEHTHLHGRLGQSRLDPLAIEPDVVPFFILSISRGRYSVVDIIRPSHRKAGGRFYVFVVANRAK